MLRNLLRWARITKSGKDDKQFPVQQMEYSGKVADGAMVSPYGYHGNVPPDTLALMVAIQGNADNRAAIGVLAKNRPQLAAGEVAFYHPTSQSWVIWREGGKLEVQSEGDVSAAVGGALTATVEGPTTLTTPLLTLNGDLAVNGSMTNNGFDVGYTHGHLQDADSDGNSEAPISGVT